MNAKRNRRHLLLEGFCFLGIYLAALTGGVLIGGSYGSWYIFIVITAIFPLRKFFVNKRWDDPEETDKCRIPQIVIIFAAVGVAVLLRHAAPVPWERIGAVIYYYAATALLAACECFAQYFWPSVGGHGITFNW